MAFKFGIIEVVLSIVGAMLISEGLERSISWPPLVIIGVGLLIVLLMTTLIQFFSKFGATGAKLLMFLLAGLLIIIGFS